jgi:hypothetical protein
MIGGMGAAGNLALNDGGEGAEKTGLALNFTLLNGRYYNLSEGTQVTHPESFVAEDSFYKMLAAGNVKTVKLDCRLLSASTVESTVESTGGETAARSTSSVESIRVLCEPDPVTATVFIDASYDGEVMVAAGNIDYTAGRESTKQYGESLAGARAPSWSGVRPSTRPVNALRDDGSIMKYVSNLTDLAAPGEADDALMAFQHRLCVSADADRIPWPKPKGYDRDDFLLMERTLEANDNNYDFFTRLPPSTLPGYPGTRKKYVKGQSKGQSTARCDVIVMMCVTPLTCAITPDTVGVSLRFTLVHENVHIY